MKAIEAEEAMILLDLDWLHALQMSKPWQDNALSLNFPPARDCVKALSVGEAEEIHVVRGFGRIPRPLGPRLSVSV